jgi:hypothetical protein
MMNEEKRRSPRIDFHHEVLIKDNEGIKKIKNFSTTGAFIETENPLQFKRGDKIGIVTRLPLEKKDMLIKAEVKYISSNGIGVQFYDLWGDKSEAIDYTYEVYKGTIPLPGTK